MDTQRDVDTVSKYPNAPPVFHFTSPLHAPITSLEQGFEGIEAGADGERVGFFGGNGASVSQTESVSEQSESSSIASGKVSGAVVPERTRRRQ